MRFSTDVYEMERNITISDGLILSVFQTIILGTLGDMNQEVVTCMEVPRLGYIIRVLMKLII